MSWTAPRTWVTGELVTSAISNTHIRDNLNAILNAMNSQAHIRRTTPVAAPLGVNALNWETEISDNLAYFTVGTPNRIQLPTAGTYMFFCNLFFAGASGSGSVSAKVQRYTGADAFLLTDAGQDGNMNNSLSMAAEMETANADDRFYVEVSTGATGSQHTWTGNFSIRRMGIF